MAPPSGGINVWPKKKDFCQDLLNNSQNTCNNGEKKQPLWHNQHIQIDDYFDETGECDDADVFFSTKRSKYDSIIIALTDVIS